MPRKTTIKAEFAQFSTILPKAVLDRFRQAVRDRGGKIGWEVARLMEADLESRKPLSKGERR